MATVFKNIDIHVVFIDFIGFTDRLFTLYNRIVSCVQLLYVCRWYNRYAARFFTSLSFSKETRGNVSPEITKRLDNFYNFSTIQFGEESDESAFDGFGSFHGYLRSSVGYAEYHAVLFAMQLLRQIQLIRDTIHITGLK